MDAVGPIFGGFILLFIVLGIFAIRWHLKRKKELAAWAAAGDWEFSPDKRRDPRHPFELFVMGSDRYSWLHAEKIFPEATAGLDAASVTLFEFHYETESASSERNSKSTHHVVCAIVSPGMDFGQIKIHAEGLGSKIAQAMGFDDIDFEDAEFSRKFVVKSKDRKHAYDLCDRRMMAYLLENRSRKYRFESAGRRLLIYKRGMATARKYASLAKFVSGFLAEIPRHLVNAERERRGLKPLLKAGSAALHHQSEEE